ncbi:MAG: hypothetical protein A3E82_03055 [Gammaproteobacteria bacterium RIFCSPHIGHO2_12_FULL_38_11]|nr:MAG: hypothetical protein A3E82_03055 [Gammaproteobacteria bacterium RIFCSPHIGHO2_12_FULL_38_11]
MTETIDYFPLKIAKGEQFINRLDEKALLNRNIEFVRHTVLLAPRRYGKSSLVYKVAEENKAPFVVVDLFLAHDDQAITKRILLGVSEAVSQIMPLTTKALSGIQKYFNNFKVSFSTHGFQIMLTHESGVTQPVDQIFDALKNLSELAESKKQKVIFFIDEFQDIAGAESSKSIEGALRHVAQSTEFLVFIFSGSTRHLLLELFDDSKKPLYKLCDKVMIERISANHYVSYLHKSAKKQWKQHLEDDIIIRILTLTELHPFYINMLCNELWKNEKIPTVNCVSKAWQICYEQEERWAIAEIEKLTDNQQDLLKAFALQPTSEPMGQLFLTSTGLPLSSLRMSLRNLLEKDFLYQIKKEDASLPFLKIGEYRVLDPLIAYALRKYS